MSDEDWDPNMKDAEFVDVSKKYFGRSYIDLHIGCCLVAKVNPETKSPPVGTGYRDWSEEHDDDGGETDYTRRPFMIARRAMTLSEQSISNYYGTVPLPVFEGKQTIYTGLDVILDTRLFVKWAIKNWSNTLNSP